MGFVSYLALAVATTVELHVSELMDILPVKAERLHAFWCF